MRVVDNLREDLIKVKENQKNLNENIAKVIGFVKRIELHMGSATEDVSELDDLDLSAVEDKAAGAHQQSKTPANNAAAAAAP
jgi:type IV secretory pathway VirB9-like protein